MNFDEWEPVYVRILSEFGYDRHGDERARDVLGELFVALTSGEGHTRGTPAEGPSELVGTTLARLDFEGETVAVAGAAPRLEDDLALVEGAGRVVAASDAARRLRRAGYAVDCMVTDLDKTPETARELTAEGTPVFVHAHGDNVPAVREHLPTFDVAAVVPTTQAAPAGPVRNFGGFTDGDRGAFLADELGAARLVFPGWSFDDSSVGPEKRHKLEWAARLLRWLERRRDEQFDVLDGRRDALDDSRGPRSRNDQ